MKYVWILFYYLFAFKLPSQYFPFGKIACKIRYFVWRKILKQNIGANVKIQKDVLVGKFDDIIIGSNVAINEKCRLRNVIIGNYVLIAPEVYILHSGHNFDSKEIPIFSQGETRYEKTIIEDDVWIGARSIILPGKIIGKGSIVAAGSVVTKNVSPYTIVGGNPAKFIKSRHI